MSIQCPNCNSSSVRKREVVYSSGTSTYSGRSRGSGFSFGLTKSFKPRISLFNGSSSGKRMSKKASEAERFPFMPSIVLCALTIFFNDNYLNWSICWFALSAMLFALACHDLVMFYTQWVCGKCGCYFVIERERTKKPIRRTSNKNTIKEATQKEITMDLDSGKPCSICGDFFPDNEFDYGNKSNRSYCRTCDKEEKKAYRAGGTAATKAYRDEKRSLWQT